MNENIKENQQTTDQLNDVLLALNKEKRKILAVKGIDENGKVETIEPEKKNQDRFMRVDRQGDALSNFLSNFYSQLKNPTDFTLFRVPGYLAVNVAEKMQDQIETPTRQGEKLFSEYGLKIKDFKEVKQKNHNTMEETQTMQETTQYRYQPEQIDWETMKDLGLSKEKLEKMNLLEPLLKGYKTNELVPVSVNLGNAIVRTDARLSLQSGEDGKVVAAVHGIRKEPNLNFEFFGHKFTDEDKKNLLETGNMGRVVDLKNLKTGELMPSIISIDRLTNEVIALKTDYIKIPDEIKEVKLNEQQKQTLLEGKPLHIEGMISKKGTEFDATVQFNADKRYVEFLFDRNQSNQQSQGNQLAEPNGQDQTQEASKTFRGKELTDDQYKDLKEGQTVYIDGLVDKKGQTYKGYITFNKETGQTNFEFPNQYKERMQPSEDHKTQTVVNSEGKTNEATKNINEPLKTGQQTPKDKKQQEQQEKKEAPAKSRGRKM